MTYFSKYQIKIEKKYNIEYKEIISEQKNIISQRDDKINEQNNKLDELQNIFALIKFNTKDPNNDYYIIALHLFNIFIKDNNISITNFLFNIDNINISKLDETFKILDTNRLILKKLIESYFLLKLDRNISETKINTTEQINVQLEMQKYTVPMDTSSKYSGFLQVYISLQSTFNFNFF